LNTDGKGISKNIFWLAIDKLIRLGLGLLLSVWIARYLGPQKFGIWNYGMALTAVYGAIATLGLDSLIVHDLVESQWSASEILGTSLMMRLLSSIVAISASCLTAFLTDSHDKTVQLVVLITSAAFIFQAFDVIDLFFQSKVQSKFSVIAKNGVFLFCAGLRFAGLFYKAGLLYFVSLTTIEAFLGSVSLIFYYQKKTDINIKKWYFNGAYAKKKMKAAWPIILSGVIIIIYMRIDQIMIKYFMTEKSVGIYSAAVKLMEVWYFIPSTITVSIFPLLIKIKSDKKKYENTIQRMFGVLFIVSFSISIVTTFFSERLISMLFGHAYLDAAFALKISTWTGIFVFLGVGAGNILVIEDLNNHNLYKSLGSVFLNILLNFFLIPKYGINGAASATLISQFFGSYLYFLFPTKTRHIFISQSKSMMFNVGR